MEDPSAAAETVEPFASVRSNKPILEAPVLLPEKSMKGKVVPVQTDEAQTGEQVR